MERGIVKVTREKLMQWKEQAEAAWGGPLPQMCIEIVREAMPSLIAEVVWLDGELVRQKELLESTRDVTDMHIAENIALRAANVALRAENELKPVAPLPLLVDLSMDKSPEVHCRFVAKSEIEGCSTQCGNMVIPGHQWCWNHMTSDEQNKVVRRLMVQVVYGANE